MKKSVAAGRGIFPFVAAYPRLILTVALLLSVLSVLYTFRSMEFLTGRDDLMPKNTPFHANYRAYRQEFGDQEEIVIVVESSDSERAARFGSRLYERLRSDRTHLKDVFFPFGLDFFKKNIGQLTR